MINPPHDDDATVIRPSGGLSGGAATPERGNTLPVRSFLHEFEVTGVLGEGGFGVVYLAWDHTLERRVALKEYMPSTLAMRGEGSQVVVRSERHRDTFAAGLKSFVNEARLLAQFDHPSLVKVYRFWEASGTAYMVMPFIEGKTLKDTLRELAAPPDEAWLMALLSPLTEALQVLHRESCFHRDIAPDNIILLAGSGLPLLLDFGAARRVIGDMTQALTVILKPGYAPIEQYAEVPGMSQGPWTDVYALAAVVYFAVMGRVPPASVGRLVSDDYQPLEQLTAGRYSQRLLQAVDRALKVRPDERTRSIDDFRVDLGLSGQPPAASGSATVIQPQLSGRMPAREGARPASSGRRRLLWTFVAVVALVGLGVAGYRLADPGRRVEPPKAEPAAPEAKTPTPVAPQAAAEADIVSQFHQVVADQSPHREVSARAERERLRIDVDELRFSISSARDGYLYVLLYGPDQVLSQIYPNDKSGSNRIQADQALKLPQPSWPLKASEPAGLEHFLVLVTAEPRSYAALATEKDSFYGFARLPSTRPASATAAGPSWLLGSPDCGRPDCAGEYGAATFSVEAVK